MINRFALAAVAAVFVITGCAKNATDKPVADFYNGATLVDVTDLPATTLDSTTIYVTVDGNDAGALIA